MPPEGSGLPDFAASPHGVKRTLRANLDLRFASDANGRSYVKRQFTTYPFHVCRALYQDPEQPGLATLYIQSCSGGVYEADDLEMRFVVEDGARVHISTQAATVVHSMLSFPASQRVSVECGEGSYVEYLPDPQVLFPHSRFKSEIAINLGAKGVVVVSDAFLCHDPNGDGETFGEYLNAIAIKGTDGESLAIDRLKVRGESFARDRPGTFGSFKAQATMIVAATDLSAHEIVSSLKNVSSEGATVGVSQLPQNCGFIVRVLATDGCALERSMRGAWSAVRFVLLGALPQRRRK